MNIIFDLQILNNNLPNEITIEQDLALQTIYGHIKERLMVLKDEIDKEELNFDGTPRLAIVIHTKRNKVIPNNYSKGLSDKIVSCFNENDGIIIFERFKLAMKDLLN